MKKFLVLLLLLVPAIAACDETPPAPKAESPNEKTEILADRLGEWMGQWNGPEGTYLKLEKSGEGYGVIIKDLDKEKRYLGVSSEMRIRFNRNNQEEYIILVPGYETGVKWLADKPYCLMVKKGEAYCRDEI